MKDKKELYYCFRYQCNRCPKQRECEEEQAKEVINMAGAPKGNQNAKKYKDKNELKKLIDKYFKDCDDSNRPYTMSGLAYALDIDRITLINYGKDELFFTLIKKAKDRVQAQLEENALMGKGNPTFTIFNLKNNYGWIDKQEINQNTSSQITIVDDLPDDEIK